MPRPGQDEFTREELRRMAWLHMFVPDPVSMLLREFGTHTEASWKMAWANLKGHMHPSALMNEVATEVDADPQFDDWRDRKHLDDPRRPRKEMPSAGDNVGSQDRGVMDQEVGCRPRVVDVDRRPSYSRCEQP